MNIFEQMLLESAAKVPLGRARVRTQSSHWMIQNPFRTRTWPDEHDCVIISFAKTAETESLQMPEA